MFFYSIDALVLIMISAIVLIVQFHMVHIFKCLLNLYALRCFASFSSIFYFHVCTGVQ